MTWSSEDDFLVTDPVWSDEDLFIEWLGDNDWLEFESIALEDPGDD